jgi:hypothetical protein
MSSGVPARYRWSVWVPALMAVAGVVVLLVGILGLFLSGGEPAATETVSTTLGAESTTSAPTTDAPTTIAVPAPDAEGFVNDLGEALQAGDEVFLFDRLHPAVLDRYGEEQCRAYLETKEIPDLVLEFRDVGGPEPWDWTLDDVTTSFAEAYTVTLYNSQAGGEEELHLVVVGGELRWFTDCGDPLG